MRRLLVELTFAVRSDLSVREMLIIESELDNAVSGFLDKYEEKTFLRYLTEDGIHVLMEDEPV